MGGAFPRRRDGRRWLRCLRRTDKEVEVLTWDQLRRLSDDEVRARYDGEAKHSTAGLQFWRDEIAFRTAERQTRAIARMTGAMLLFTVVVAVCTIVLLLW